MILAFHMNQQRQLLREYQFFFITYYSIQVISC